MNDPTELVDRYIAMWNEADSGRRQGLIARTWTETVRYVDPVMAGEGRDGIDAMVGAVQARFPGHSFRRTGEVDAHHDRLRFTWELAPQDGPAVVGGTDFATVAGDRLETVTGFFDHIAAAPAA